MTVSELIQELSKFDPDMLCITTLGDEIDDIDMLTVTKIHITGSTSKDWCTDTNDCYYCQKGNTITSALLIE